MAGVLYIVATPIGNLADISFRAIEVLKNTDYILCEDTRVTKKLLDHYQITTPTISYHQHSDNKKVKEIERLLALDKKLALVTDAGTPGISDPGNLLIADILKLEDKNTFDNNKIQIIPVPGASAVIALLSISGFPTDKYLFLGFPPHKNKRQKFFKEIGESKYTVVFYESSHRIKKCLENLTEVLEPTRQIIIGRELTKMHETIYRGTMAEILKMDIMEKGEFVIVISSGSRKS